MPDKIYVITVMEKLEHNKTTGFPVYGSTAIPGWYKNKQDAVDVVTCNICDIWETVYDYAVIEEVKEGLYNPAMKDQRWFYRFNKETGGYEPIDEPAFMEHFAGISFS